MIRPMALVAALAFGAAGCGDDESSNLNGSLQFDYSGTRSGTFTAIGRVTLPATPGTTWATGVRDDEGNIIVFAEVPRPAGRHDGIAINVPRLTPGSDPISLAVECSNFKCATIEVEFNTSNETGSEQYCRLRSGTVALSSISDKRASGSFSGEGECDSQTGTAAFTITNGIFDVPLITPDDFR